MTQVDRRAQLDIGVCILLMRVSRINMYQLTCLAIRFLNDDQYT